MALCRLPSIAASGVHSAGLGLATQGRGVGALHFFRKTWYLGQLRGVLRFGG